MIFGQIVSVIFICLLFSFLLGVVIAKLVVKIRIKSFVLAGKVDNTSEKKFTIRNNASQGLGKTAEIIIIIALISIIYWIIALLVTWNSPATAYESSIYLSTPLIFWISNAINVFVGIGIVIHQLTYPNNKRETDLGAIGFILIFMAFASVLALWVIRGYTLLGEGDPLTHLGMVRNIIATGTLQSSNYYPVTHIYLAELSEMSNISPEVFSKCIPVLCGLFNILFTFCLARTALPKKGQALIAIVVWITFLSGSYTDLIPNILANFYFPLALLLLIKCFYSNQIQWRIIFIVMIFLLPLFHPLIGFMITGFAIIMWIYDKVVKSDHSTISSTNSRYIFMVSLVALVWNVIWNSSFQPWKDLMTNVVSNLTKGGTSNITDITSQIAYASQYNYNVVEMFLKTYLGELIIIGIAALSAAILWRKGYFKKKTEKIGLLIAPIPMVVAVIAFLYLENTGFAPARLVIYVILLCTFFCGYFLFGLLRRSNERDRLFPRSFFQRSFISVVGISGILSILFVMGILQMYPSRYVLQPNLQITQTEYYGMDMFLQVKDANVPQTSLTVNTYRWASLFLSPAEVSKRTDLLYPQADTPPNLLIPWHFGYEKTPDLGQVYRNDIYMVLSSRCKMIYQDIWPEMAKIRFQTSDFKNVEEDPSINKIYSNGGLAFYYINSTRQGSFQPNPYKWAE